VHRKQAVVIAAMTGDGKIVLIRQERIRSGQAIWEMPSGQVDDHNADQGKLRQQRCANSAKKTGYELAPDGQVVSLGYYFSSPGFTDERGYFFLARPVRACEKGPNCDEGESILDAVNLV